MRENLRLQLLATAFAILASTIGFGATAAAASPDSQGTETVASAPPTSAAETPEGPALGMSLSLLNESESQQSATLEALYGIGLRWVRVEANWSWIQYAGPSSFDWSALDQEVGAIIAAGMHVDPLIDDAPQWARAGDSTVDSTQPASAAAFATFAGEVAARYGAMDVATYEIWNEPNIQAFWEPAPNPSFYTTMLVDSYAAIKAVQPYSTVISGGLAPATTDGTNFSPVDFLTQMYADGAKGSFDALGDHAYSYPALPDTYETWSGWSEIDQTSPSLRSVMTANGDTDTQIWITEVGAPSAGPNGVGLTAQADEVTQAVQNAECSPWIGALFVYTYQDSATRDTATNPDYFGLVNADGSPKPAWSALAAADGVSPACTIASQSTVTLGQPCDASVSGSDRAPAVAARAVATPAAATPEVAAPVLLPLAALVLGGIWLGLRRRRTDRHAEVAAS